MKNITLTMIGATYAVMTSIGAMNASFGAVLPLLESRFLVSSDLIGFLGTAQTVGGVLGNLSTAFLERRFSIGQQMLIGSAVFAAGAVAFAVAFWLQLGFAVALLALFLMGLGLGLFQVNYASVFSKGFGARSSAMMSVMSTAFAVGSIIGPLLAVWLAALYAWLPVLFAAVALISAAALRRMVMPSLLPTARGGAIGTEVWLFAVMIGLYVVAEQGAAFWGITHLVSIGWEAPAAAAVFSSFWLALLIGRLCGAALAVRIRGEVVLVVALSVGTLALAATNIAAIAAPAYLLVGLFYAPTFPIGLTLMAQRNPSSLATTIYLIAGSVGAAVGTPLVGWCKSQFGDAAIPVSLTVASALCLGLLLFLLRARQTSQRL